MTGPHELRKLWGRVVSMACGSAPPFAEQFAIRDADGCRVAVPLLDQDSVAMACELIRQAGGAGTLAILRSSMVRGKDSLPAHALIAVRLQRRSDDPFADIGSLPLTGQTTLADLLDVAKAGVTLTFHFESADMLLRGGLPEAPLPREARAALVAA